MVMEIHLLMRRVFRVEHGELTVRDGDRDYTTRGRGSFAEDFIGC
jgi:hypothetical protein